MIPPGRAGKLEAKVKTSELRGELSRNIAVTTNDPRTPMTHLTVRLRVAGSVELLPHATLDLRPGPGGTGSTARVLARQDPSESGKLKVTDVTASKPWLHATAKRVEVAEPGEGRVPAAAPGDWWLEVEATEGVPPGLSRETLTFSTGLTREPKITVPVMVSVALPIVLSAESIRVPSPGAGKEFRHPILVSVRVDLDPGGLTAKATPPYDVSLERAGQRHWRAWITRPADKGAPSRGEVVFAVGPHSQTLVVEEVPASAGQPGPPAGPATKP